MHGWILKHIFKVCFYALNKNSNIRLYQIKKKIFFISLKLPKVSNELFFQIVHLEIWKF